MGPLNEPCGCRRALSTPGVGAAGRVGGNIGNPGHPYHEEMAETFLLSRRRQRRTNASMSCSPCRAIAADGTILGCSTIFGYLLIRHG